MISYTQVAPVDVHTWGTSKKSTKLRHAYERMYPETVTHIGFNERNAVVWVTVRPRPDLAVKQ